MMRAPAFWQHDGLLPRLLAPLGALYAAATARRIARVLWNDPATGVMRHADAGYEEAIACAREQGLDLPMVR